MSLTRNVRHFQQPQARQKLSFLLRFGCDLVGFGGQQYSGELHIEERFHACHPFGQRDRFRLGEEGRIAKVFQNQVLGVQQSQNIIEARRVRSGSQQRKSIEEKLPLVVQKQPLQEFSRGHRIGRESFDQLVETRLHLMG